MNNEKRHRGIEKNYREKRGKNGKHVVKMKRDVKSMGRDVKIIRRDIEKMMREV